MPQIKLKKINPDDYNYLLEMQGKIKAEKNIGIYSLESTIYAIIKEHREIHKKKKTA